MTIMARFSGTCSDCDQRWQPGDLIRAGDCTEEGLPTMWMHAVCPDDRPAALVGKQCPTCHLTMPLTGICDECEDR